MKHSRQSTDSHLPVPGTVYSIPTGTHADLDLQDDKDQVLQDSYRRRSRRRLFYR
jgi:hypothetical protein